MNDDARLEQLFGDALADLAPTRAPHRLKDQIKTDSGRTQPRPRWLALMKEPPMRLSSSLAVGSPTARLAAVIAATLLLLLGVLGAGVAGQQLLAASSPIVVAQDGSGTVTTLTEAVEMAADGDTILVKPGTYVEAVVVDKDLTIKGDGDRADIVIEAPDDGPSAPITSLAFSEEDSYAILLQDVEATLSDLTFRGQRSMVFVSGGAPVLERLTFDGTAYPYRGGSGTRGNSIVLNGGTAATVRESELIGGGPIGIFDLSPVTIDSNHLVDGPHIWGGGDDTIIRGNTIERPLVRAIGVFDPAAVLIEQNTIIGAGQTGIDIWEGSPTVRLNHIEGSGINGIYVESADVTIAENGFVDNGIVISWSGSTGSIEDNTISGGTVGIVVSSGTPVVSGNTVSGVTGQGISVARGTSPTLRDNAVCDNGTDVFVADGATPDIDDSNEICGGISTP